MKKNSLSATGLSLSQAQSVSNLCHQRALEIARKLLTVNNYSKTVKVAGETLPLVVETGVKLPENVVDLIKEKASLHACQAFLMENIKAKAEGIEVTKRGVADVSEVKFPKTPDYIKPAVLPNVTEDFGWSQLTAAENNEYLEAEAYASHIGEFIHKDSILAGLRNELPQIPAIEWFEIEKDKKVPVTITKHHTAEELLKLHETLAELHRGYEQHVNRFKAKVKNLTTEENARIAKVNADAGNEADKTNSDLRLTYEMEYKKASEQVQAIKNEYEKTRQAKIKELAATKILVDIRFKTVIDGFLSKLPESQE
ncbi:MAG: hypothetical protein WC428_02705 [Candidatus Paceibacterota bacterium]|jgi:hypothetical protein